MWQCEFEKAKLVLGGLRWSDGVKLFDLDYEPCHPNVCCKCSMDELRLRLVRVFEPHGGALFITHMSIHDCAKGY